VDGLLLKDVAPEALVRCLRRVAAGEQSMDRKSIAQALQRLLRRETAARELARDLSEREIEIVRNVASGARNREVADRLHISEGTVKVHLHNIYEKLGVKTRVQLTIYAANKGLV
jgi:DNA-binding NarL/FixJ family response regulator